MEWRERKRWREEVLIKGALLFGARYAFDISRLTGLRAARVYAVLHYWEGVGKVEAEFVSGPEPRRRAYRWVGP